MEEFKIGDYIQFEDKLPLGKKNYPVRRTIKGRIERITSDFYVVNYEYYEHRRDGTQRLAGTTFVQKDKAKKCCEGNV